MAKTRQTSKAKSSGYVRGTTGFDARGNRVSPNSPRAVSVGTVKGGAAASAPAQSPAPAPADASSPSRFAQASETVAGYDRPIDYTVSDDPAITARNRAKAFQSASRRSSVVATSDAAREAVTAATAYLDQQAQRKAQQRAQREEAARQQELAASQPGAGATESAGAPETSLQGTMSAISADMASEESRARVAANAAQQEAASRDFQRQLAAQTRKIDALTRDMDDRTAEIVRSISDEYAGLAEEQRAANEAYQAGVTTAGLVSGRSRYAPEIQAGVAKAAYDQGLAKLEDIQAKRARLILEAESARDEQRWRELTAKMDLVRESYREERDTARQVQQDVRDAIKFERESFEYIGANLAPSVAALMTGDPTEDDQVILMYAQQAGIPPTQLARHVDDYRRRQIADAPGIAGEFLWLQRNGGLPAGVSTPMQYLSYKESIGRAPASPGKKIPQSLANEAGIKGLGGVTYEDFYDVAVGPNGELLGGMGPAKDGDTTAPEWFMEIKRRDYGGTVPGDIEKQWDDFRKSPAAQQLVQNTRPKSDGTSFSVLTVEE